LSPEQQRAEMCQKAFDASRQPAEKILVLDVLELHPSTEGLTLAIKAMQVAGLKAEATQATLVIAQKLSGKVDVSEQLSKAGLDKVKLEIVKAEYGAGGTQKDVTDVLQKQAGDSLLVTLPAEGYNASFGGDPVPNTPKVLKIQYKINGKSGEATFAEDVVLADTAEVELLGDDVHAPAIQSAFGRGPILLDSDGRKLAEPFDPDRSFTGHNGGQLN
jgi:hypothetical protein